MLETPQAPKTPPGGRRRRADDALFRRYRETRDPALRGAIAERFLPLVRNLARRYAQGSEPMDDLVQVGSIGLLNAIDRYDPDAGTAFSSFAVPTILGEIKRHFRDRTWSVRVPRSLQELAGRIRGAERELEAALGRIPTAAELAGELGTDVEQLLSARTVAAGQYAVSLDRTMGADDADGKTIADRFEVTEAGYGTVDDAFTLSTLMQGLDERMREILRLRFEQDLTQAEIAERVGLSQMHVSRLIRDALRHMASRGTRADRGAEPPAPLVSSSTSERTPPCPNGPTPPR
jgi:RNA polymerase sigma-B factor